MCTVYWRGFSKILLDKLATSVDVSRGKPKTVFPSTSLTTSCGGHWGSVSNFKGFCIQNKEGELPELLSGNCFLFLFKQYSQLLWDWSCFQP